MNCRHCKQKLEDTFVDLGFSPPSNAYLTYQELSRPELYFPLRLKVCRNCWLVQTEDYANASDLFDSNYAYFSSTSASWLEHSRKYVETIAPRLGLSSSSFVIEVASNDGYLLKNFLQKGIPCLGIEPTDSTADASESLGIPTLREFFGIALAERLKSEERQADLIIGNNVYAHVPDINDFTRGLKIALKPSGCITLEFPHLMRLIEFGQFDTVYHEHYSYLSLHAVKRIFESAGLRVFDVEELPTHGGSLRIYGCHNESMQAETAQVGRILDNELEHGLMKIDAYIDFQSKANNIKDRFMEFLILQKRDGKKVVGYGAAAKGNTLINFAGVKPDLLPFVYDAAPSKQGKFLPGSHIPILNPESLHDYKPDFIVVFPWNILEEVRNQLDFIRQWGGKLVVFVPELKFL